MANYDNDTRRNQGGNNQDQSQSRNQNQGGSSQRGFASMDSDRQREIASKGGQSVPAEERSFSRDRELASEAGRKGGENSHGGGRSGSQRGGNQDQDE
jgi:general stress protein YciG